MSQGRAFLGQFLLVSILVGGCALADDAARGLGSRAEWVGLRAAEDRLVHMKMSVLTTALGRYVLEHGSYPTSDLIEARDVPQLGDYLTEEQLDYLTIDSWCERIMYRSNGEHYALISAGPDRVIGEKLTAGTAIRNFVDELGLTLQECDEGTLAFDIIGSQGGYYNYCHPDGSRSD